MKGMNRILRGYSFRELLRYVSRRKGRAGVPPGRLIGGNMASRGLRGLLQEFVTARRLRPDIQKATWHNSLRLPPGDWLSDEQWCEFVAAYMRRMGFSETHLYCVWAHDDELAVHIVACRIGLDGRVYLGQNENLASTRHIQDLEREFGLRITPGPRYLNPEDDPASWRPVQAPVRGASKAELNESVRTGRLSPRRRLQQLIDAAVIGTPTVVEFVERLQAEGVAVRANVASTGTLSGLSFLLEDEVFKGSDLGKAYAWKALQARGVSYEQARDRTQLAGIGAGAPAAAGDDRASGADHATGDAGAGAEPPVRIDAGAGDTSARVGGVRVLGSGGADRYHRRDAGIAGSAGAGDGDAPEPCPPMSAGGDADDKWSLGTAQAQYRTADAGGAGGPEGNGRSAAPRPLKPDHLVKLELWRRQARALGAPRYRVTVVDQSRGAGRNGINLGKRRGAEGAETLYTPSQVEELIPRLRRWNALGWNVYVTPIDPAHHYLVIDDMKSGATERLEGLGFAPCVVLETSAGNEQAVLKVPAEDERVEETAANALVRDLNLAYGDPRFSGGEHAFRMAGFSNKKPGRQSAFTRLILSVPRICRRAAELLMRRRRIADEERRRRRSEVEARERREERRGQGLGPQRSQVQSARFGASTPMLDALAAFRDAAAVVRAAVVRRGLAIDASRVDFQAAKRMLRNGWSDDEVFAAMLTGSPELSARHSRPEDYVLRTIEAARAAVGREPSEASASRFGFRPRGG